jgi:uncharacterized membrane protein
MSKSIQKLFPEEIGHEEEKPAPDIDSLQQKYALNWRSGAKESGYLQSLDGQGLMNIAQENDCIINLHHRPGDFLVQDMVLCEVLCNEECDKKSV